MPVSIDTANSFSVDKISLADRNIVVTGAASETGSAVCVAAARSGASVILLDRIQRDLIPVYDQICELGYPEPMMVEIDLRRAQPEGFMVLAESLSQTCAEIHGLVHCAMWGSPLTPVAHSDMPAWQKILDQQLIRPMYLTRSLYPLLKHSNPVSIIFSVLASGRSGSAYWGATGRRLRRYRKPVSNPVPGMGKPEYPCQHAGLRESENRASKTILSGREFWAVARPG